MMDIDLDYSLNPGEIIYGARAVRLDPTTQDNCLLGQQNSRCIGITPQQSSYAPGMIGNSSYPYPLADPNSATGNQKVPVYGPGRKCLYDIDPNFGGQVRPNDLLISWDSGLGRPATPTGSWNQWIIAVALSFANGAQSCNVRVVMFPWIPTGS